MGDSRALFETASGSTPVPNLYAYVEYDFLAAKEELTCRPEGEHE